MTMDDIVFIIQICIFLNFVPISIKYFLSRKKIKRSSLVIAEYFGIKAFVHTFATNILITNNKDMRKIKTP